MFDHKYMANLINREAEQELIEFLHASDLAGDYICTFEMDEKGHYLFRGSCKKKLTWWRKLKRFFKLKRFL